MSDILDVIVSRRSVKSYKEDMVEDFLIEKVVKAGMYAPSGRNRQSAIILAITNREIRNKLSSLLAESRGVDIDPFYGAPVAIVVLVDKSVNTALYDGSVVIENMLLEAHSLRLGACWVHHAKEIFEMDYGQDLLKSLGIHGDYEGVGTCILGYAQDYPQNIIPRKDNYVYYLK